MTNPTPHTTCATAADLADLVARILSKLRAVSPHANLAMYQAAVLHALAEALDELHAGAEAEATSADIRDEIAVRRHRREERERQDLDDRLRRAEER